MYIPLQCIQQVRKRITSNKTVILVGHLISPFGQSIYQNRKFLAFIMYIFGIPLLADLGQKSSAVSCARTHSDSNPVRFFLSGHYFVHLIFVLAYFMESLIYLFKCLLLQQLQLLLTKCKQLLKNGFSGCKNRICHH